MESSQRADEPTPEIDESPLRSAGRRPPLRPALAAAGGLVLLISLVLPWYKDARQHLPQQVRSAVDLATYTRSPGVERTELLAIVAIAAIAAAAAVRPPRSCATSGCSAGPLCDRGSGGATRHLYAAAGARTQGGASQRTSLQFGLVQLGSAWSLVVVAEQSRPAQEPATPAAHRSRTRLARRGGRRRRARARGAGRRRAGGRRALTRATAEPGARHSAEPGARGSDNAGAA